MSGDGNVCHRHPPTRLLASLKSSKLGNRALRLFEDAGKAETVGSAIPSPDPGRALVTGRLDDFDPRASAVAPSPFLNLFLTTCAVDRQ